MGLPAVPIPSTTVIVAGEKVQVRGLSRAEALKITSDYAGDMDGAETYILSVGAGVPLDEAKLWRESSPPDVVGLVVDLVIELSGLTEESGKGLNAG